MPPKVSVLIPSYNRPYETRRAVESVLNQSFSSLEIIVIDDNGEETPKQAETESLLQDIIEKRAIKYVRHKLNYGGNVARNTGLKTSKGKYVALLDSDDEFYSKKIELQVRFLESLPDNSPVKAVTCNRDYYIRGSVVSTTKDEGTGDFTLSLLTLENKLAAGSSILIERDSLIAIGMFDPELKRHQEVEMLLRYFQVNTLSILPENLVAIHVDDRSNIPSSTDFINNKKAFLEKAAPAIGKASPNQRKTIFRMHNLEIAKVCIRNKNLFKSIYYLLLAKPRPHELKRFIAESLQSAARHLNSRRTQ